ncbi:TPA: hypothetical protein RQO74_000283 [Klebsiella michiganensis]|nr:hypothetical protein [Klebsiella michiganensis]
MSFTVNKSVNKITTYPEFGSESEVTQESIDLTFTPQRLLTLDANGSALVVFDVDLPGASTGSYHFRFDYSGSGSPIEEAEAALKSSLLD